VRAPQKRVFHPPSRGRTNRSTSEDFWSDRVQPSGSRVGPLLLSSPEPPPTSTAEIPRGWRGKRSSSCTCPEPLPHSASLGPSQGSAVLAWQRGACLAARCWQCDQQRLARRTHGALGRGNACCACKQAMCMGSRRRTAACRLLQAPLAGFEEHPPCRPWLPLSDQPRSLQIYSCVGALAAHQPGVCSGPVGRRSRCSQECGPRSSARSSQIKRGSNWNSLIKRVLLILKNNLLAVFLF